LLAIEKAVRLNPKLPAFLLSYQGWIYYHKGMFQEGFSALKKSFDLQSNNVPNRFRLAACYSSMGRDEEARAEIASLLKLSPEFSLAHFSKTMPYKNQADLVLMMNALRKAGLK
jgi:adenylate cyclase